MRNLTELANPEMNIAERTLDFVKKQLSGIEFAVTGSYARDVLNDYSTFNKDSDLDIIVEEKYAKRVANMLLTTQNYNTLEKVKKYDPPRYDVIKKTRAYGGSGGGSGGSGGGSSGSDDGDIPLPPMVPEGARTIEKVKKYAPPRFNEIKKMNDYGGGGGGGKKVNKGFSEYLLKGNLIPIHVIGSYTNKQKTEAVNVDGIKYLEPVSPKYLKVA